MKKVLIELSEEESWWKEGTMICVQNVNEDYFPEFALQIDGDDMHDWWLDSGCSQHMTSLKKYFHHYIQFNNPFTSYPGS